MKLENGSINHLVDWISEQGNKLTKFSASIKIINLAGRGKAIFALAAVQKLNISISMEEYWRGNLFSLSFPGKDTQR